MLVAAAALLPSCTWFSGDATVLVTSEPPGARIILDGEETGQTTPSKLELGGILGGDHAITIQKQGFRDETRRVFHYTQGYTSKWIEGVSTESLPAFPMFWTAGDWFFPFGVKWVYVPHEVHVRLYAEGSPPLGRDALAARVDLNATNE